MDSKWHGRCSSSRSYRSPFICADPGVYWFGIIPVVFLFAITSLTFSLLYRTGPVSIASLVLDAFTALARTRRLFTREFFTQSDIRPRLVQSLIQSILSVGSVVSSLCRDDIIALLAQLAESVEYDLFYDTLLPDALPLTTIAIGVSDRPHDIPSFCRVLSSYLSDVENI